MLDMDISGKDGIRLDIVIADVMVRIYSQKLSLQWQVSYPDAKKIGTFHVWMARSESEGCT